MNLYTYAKSRSRFASALQGFAAASILCSILTLRSNASAAGITDPCLPFDPVSTDVLFASEKEVFGHYFYPFPLSMSNKPAATDYYNVHYLNPYGENGKYLDRGGFLRQRPLPVTPVSSPDWKLLNIKREVRMAIARGLTGFTYAAMDVNQVSNLSSPLNLLLRAAQEVDPRFKIMIMPDMNALDNAEARGEDKRQSVLAIIRLAAKSQSSYRLSDGRLVVTAFNASYDVTSDWWKSIFNQLASEGISVAFVPTFLGWAKYADQYKSISYGYSDWGTATVAAMANFQSAPAKARSTYGRMFMMPIEVQQYRPKSNSLWEASNSGAFRRSWMSAINGYADWTQIVTWGDFSESGQVEPYTDATLAKDIGTGYYNLNLYYATWFLTGKQPVITHDVLYYFYRREPVGAAAPMQSQRVSTAIGTPAENNIELLAFLKTPGTLKITLGNATYTQDAPAGVSSFKVPLQPGKPIFSLVRNAANVFSVPGKVQIYGAEGLPSGYQDLTYWTGSGSVAGTCALSAN